MFCFEKQIEWVKFLFLIEFVYQNNVQFIIECNSFFCMYDYNSEIRYESKDDIIMKRMFVATKRVKELIEYKQKNDKKQRMLKSNITIESILRWTLKKSIW